MTLAYKYLKKTYRLISYSKRVLVSRIRRLFNFIIPNLKFIISGRLSFKNIPRCQQKTLLTGSGVIDIGKNCSFGYKLGGFHRGGAIEIQPRYKSSKIVIGNNVTILKNSEIEENTIIAAGAVVSGKFPKNVIIGGIPAKVIKGI